MFIGHFAVGMLSKRSDELPSLAMMFLAVQLLDLVWPILVLLGVESLSIDPNNTKLTHLSFDFYPYSHSLLAAVVWGLLLGIVYFLVTKNKKRLYDTWAFGDKPLDIGSHYSQTRLTFVALLRVKIWFWPLELSRI